MSRTPRHVLYEVDACAGPQRRPSARVASRTRRRGLLAVSVLACGIALSAPVLAQDTLGQYRFESGGRVMQIPSIRERGSGTTPGDTLVSLRGIVEGGGGSLRSANAPNMLLAVIAGTTLQFPLGEPSVVVVGERVVSLSRGARRIGGDLYLPLDFLTQVVAPILNRTAPPSSRQAPSRPAPMPLAAAAAPAASASAASASATAATSPSAPALAAPAGAKVSGGPSFTVVIDPGHGGSETGAEGKKGSDGSPGILEKDITLDIARRLRTVLQGQPGTSVLLTRDEDAVVALDDRTALANHNHADLFLSIHVNSAARREARGAETYFLSYSAKDEDIRTLAAIENNAAGVDKEKLGDAPEGLELILWDLAQSAYLQESGELAGSIQKELNEALGARNRGVRQAPFRVLMGATMPAVLVEVGFISNPAEETSLATEEYRDKIAQALSRAVTTFLADAKRRMGAAARNR